MNRVRPEDLMEVLKWLGDNDYIVSQIDYQESENLKMPYYTVLFSQRIYPEDN